MPHSVSLISTIAVGLGLSLILGFVAVRLRLPALVGYLVTGMIVGPFTPGFVADAEIASQLAEIGIMLLMFGVGLHFSFADLMAVRRLALPGAVVQMTVATLMGMGLGLGPGSGADAGAGPVGGQHGGVAAGPGVVRADRFLHRAGGDRLVGRGRLGHGAGAGAFAAFGGCPGRARPGGNCCRQSLLAGHPGAHALACRRLRGGDAGAGPPPLPLVAEAGAPNRLTRAFHAVRG